MRKPNDSIFYLPPHPGDELVGRLGLYGQEIQRGIDKLLHLIEKTIDSGKSWADELPHEQKVLMVLMQDGPIMRAKVATGISGRGIYPIRGVRLFNEIDGSGKEIGVQNYFPVGGWTGTGQEVMSDLRMALEDQYPPCDYAAAIGGFTVRRKGTNKEEGVAVGLVIAPDSQLLFASMNDQSYSIEASQSEIEDILSGLLHASSAASWSLDSSVLVGALKIWIQEISENWGSAGDNQTTNGSSHAESASAEDEDSALQEIQHIAKELAEARMSLLLEECQILGDVALAMAETIKSSGASLALVARGSKRQVDATSKRYMKERKAQKAAYDELKSRADQQEETIINLQRQLAQALKSKKS